MKIDVSLKNYFAVSDAVSLMNMVSGFLSIICAINHDFRLSAILMIVAIMFDSVDGWVARKLNRDDKFKFGETIDSLSDIVSFGVSPAIFLYSIATTINQIPMIFVYIVSIIMVICGVLRLTRYNALADYIDYKGFIGFPIPGIAIILSTFYLSGIFDITSAIVLMLIVSILMISDFRYPKISNIPILAIAVIMIILIIIPLPIPIVFDNVNIPALILLILSLYYLLINLVIRK